MKKLIRKDLKIRKIVKQLEQKRLFLKALLMNTSIAANVKLDVQNKLAKLPRNSSKTRIVNRCVITGRGNGVFQLYNLSRIQIKHLALNGDLPGLKKFSW
eukprot:Amastigsp_a514441_10.p2 type:complete len:100 gc:universal Amastigsp_a514441_10:661-362(-)